jgi:hypothetical protein
MSGNQKKYRRNKPGGDRGDAMVKTAIDLEEAAHAVNNINRRKRREAQEKREKQKRAEITLPSLESIRKFMRG